MSGFRGRPVFPSIIRDRTAIAGILFNGFTNKMLAVCCLTDDPKKSHIIAVLPTTAGRLSQRDKREAVMIATAINNYAALERMAPIVLESEVRSLDGQEYYLVPKAKVDELQFVHPVDVQVMESSC